VIAGGGLAALEAVLALRALAADRVHVTLISPYPTFAYRPAATAEAFGDAPPQTDDVRAIARDLGATYHRVRLEAVAPQKKYVRLASGARLEYDALILAIGARSIASVPGALTFRDQRDVPLFRRLLHEVEAGAAGRLVFAVRSGFSWSLPLYELALLSATHAAEHHAETEVTIVSPEETPLAMFGAEASRLVADLLAERGVRFVGKSAASSVRRDGSVVLEFAGGIEADRVVAMPQLRGQRITGVPASWWGFVPTDTFGRVEDLVDVYAAGDMTTFPIKQGGLAAQQADRVTHTIAAALGLPVGEFRAPRVLRARLLGGERPLFLRTELDESGQPTGASLEHAETEEAASSTKVFGRYLAPYLETRQPLAHSPLASAARTLPNEKTAASAGLQL
jgi:sulfide:quinone oxidoreductase